MWISITDQRIVLLISMQLVV